MVDDEFVYEVTIYGYVVASFLFKTHRIALGYIYQLGYQTYDPNKTDTYYQNSNNEFKATITQRKVFGDF